MEFKVIFYVLVAIGYFIYTNYQKLVQQNKNRNLTGPPQEPPQSAPPVFQETKLPPKRQTIKVKQMARQNKPAMLSKRIAPITAGPKPISVATSADIASLETPQAMQHFYAQTLQTDINSTPQKVDSKKTFDPKTFRNAIILGEIINKPAWTKY
jgi:hypothetical protein